MADYLRKCIALNPSYARGTQGSYDYKNTTAAIIDSNNTYIKIWVDFMALAPLREAGDPAQDNSQRDPRTNLTPAQQESYGGYSAPIIAAPAVGDVPGGSNSTNYETFTDDVLAHLRYLGRQGNVPNVAWSLHNYEDVKDSDQGFGTTTRAEIVRERLSEWGWNGWGNGDSEAPYVLATEGGYNLKGDHSQGNLEKQRQGIVSAYEAAHNASLGGGIGMFTQYLMYTVEAYDSGLLDGAGNPRPAAGANGNYGWSELVSP
jgi:hypothetical protein